jgi:hypothetical protein
MRAGLAFVIVALLMGQGFREWRRGHEERFEDLVRELESRDSRSRETPAAETDAAGVDSAAGRPAGETGRESRRAPRGVPVGRIDPNRANALELERLPGIGPALAGRIVADRDRRGPFPSPEALLRVPGIGPIRVYLSFPAAAGGDSLTGF